MKALLMNRSVAFSGCLINTFDCKDTHFKCPGYYCVPWRYVCDMQWDCPGGTDEIHCNRSVTGTSCPGQFACSNSVTCVAMSDLCNNFIDCQNGDDETFCKPSIPDCISGCFCVLYAISCIHGCNITRIKTSISISKSILHHANLGNLSFTLNWIDCLTVEKCSLSTFQGFTFINLDYRSDIKSSSKFAIIRRLIDPETPPSPYL